MRAKVGGRDAKEIPMTSKQQLRGRKGDRVLVEAHKVGAAARSGKILEVLGTAGAERYRIKWQDGHESVCAPSSDMRFVPKPKPARAKA
jgi:hypothetical protein